ncbi:AraC family transcriptional regulator [Cohnella sp. LGH]|uniref:AraC family transcriptional regulator n=1 Tax=Cohnella sp. LGH TaxID=1619153 RepID=UPI001ADD45E9|nr:helix-turn-helix domain-containing protein [Cohnella sp. LGH]QTH41983.1 AraC family transcriptional regulator [Cohnella sp. LGH]
MEYFLLPRTSSLDVRWTGVFEARSGLVESSHHNPHYELIAVAEGPVYLQVGERQMVLKSGETLLLKPWEQHSSLKQTESGRFFWVQFSSDPPLHELGSSTNYSEDLNIVHALPNELRTSSRSDVDGLLIPRQFQLSNRYRLMTEFERLIEESNEPEGYYRYRMSLILAGMLGLIAEELRQSSNEFHIPVSFLTFRRIVNYLDETYTQNVRKEAIERSLERKYEYICQVFKKYAGITIVTYVQQLRIQRAKYLLSNSVASLQEIAAEVGFEDPFYFSRVFKKIEGTSPTVYRERTEIGLE